MYEHVLSTKFCFYKKQYTTTFAAVTREVDLVSISQLCYTLKQDRNHHCVNIYL